MPLLLKTVMTAILVTAISELARRYSLFAAAIASLPITATLAIVWLYHDTKDVTKIIPLSYDIAWLVLPSLIFFIALPWLLQQGVKFYPALLLSFVAMFALYGAFIYIRKLAAAQ